MRTQRHPTLDIICREDGAVYAPARGSKHFRWTFGSKKSNGYLVIGYKGKHYRVHRLIAEAFLPNPENKPTVDHIDMNKQNNALSNLRWATMQEQNLNHGGHHRVLERGGAMAANRSEYKKEYYQRRNAAGLIRHYCCDGRERWHLPGHCPVCRLNGEIAPTPIWIEFTGKLV